MNERITELANRAIVERANGFREFDANVFAELIVRECVRYFNEDYERDFDTLWREDLSRGIKQNFGVEE